MGGSGQGLGPGVDACLDAQGEAVTQRVERVLFADTGYQVIGK